MASAYAALVSLTHILHQTLHPPPLNQIIVVREQIESLREKVNLLLDFLENYSSRGNEEIEDLETRIADATYAAEDVIESNVVDQIRATSAIDREKTSTLLSEGVQKVIEEFLSIEKELMKIKDKKGVDDDMRPTNSTSTTASMSSRPLFTSGKNSNTMVGFDEHVNEIMSALTTDEPNRQIIPIVGMGGIGKTTLATNVYNNPFIVEHFYVRAWVTVTQEYNGREIFLILLYQILKEEEQSEDKSPNEKERRENFNNKMSRQNDDELGLLLHKELFERKYLIVLDDMWNVEGWDNVERFLPGNNNGSRILVTTRLLQLAREFGSGTPYEMNFLDEEQSWDLLREKIFEQDDCPVQLEVVGKSIAKRCRGLPLALVVIGGLLAKSEKTREHWESIERDVNSAINQENDEHFMKILSLSYRYLPIYLKPCFLYMAWFPEDFEIHVSRIVRLWVAEGFIKPSMSKNLEEVAEDYLQDLIDRNLILIRKRVSSGKVKTCGIHDLLRDLCKSQSHKDKFLRIAKLDDPNILPYIERERRLGIHYSTMEANICKALLSLLSVHYSSMEEKTCKALQSGTHCRSLLSYFRWETNLVARRCSLMRVLDAPDFYHVLEIQRQINLRYVACITQTPRISVDMMTSSLSHVWSLQTLVLHGRVCLPVEVWQMRQLRHIKITTVHLVDPPDDAQVLDGQNVIVLVNLQTLSTVQDFKFTKEVCKRIPNLNKLRITCLTGGMAHYGMSNLVHLHKLESFYLYSRGTLIGNIAFPSSLKKLTLRGCKIPWEDMSIVGLLPDLQILKLSNAAEGREWNPIEGEFCQLKLLLIERCSEWEIWTADNTHFPCLEQLHFEYLSLKEIPVDFAEILSLQLVVLNHCSSSLMESAKEISEERENLGYEPLQVHEK